MKYLILVTLLIAGSMAIASSSKLVYTTGHAVGTEATTGTYLGYYQMCFIGNAYSAKAKIYNFGKNDSEKDSFFVRYDKNKNQIVYGYVDTKCLDEGESRNTCSTFQVVPACKQAVEFGFIKATYT